MLRFREARLDEQHAMEHTDVLLMPRQGAGGGVQDFAYTVIQPIGSRVDKKVYALT